VSGFQGNSDVYAIPAGSLPSATLPLAVADQIMVVQQNAARIVAAGIFFNSFSLGTINPNEQELAFISGANLTVPGPLTRNVTVIVGPGVSGGNLTVYLPIAVGSLWEVEVIDGTGALSPSRTLTIVPLTGSISGAASGTTTLYSPYASWVGKDTATLGWMRKAT
jgi:hypothetical protein